MKPEKAVKGRTVSKPAKRAEPLSFPLSLESDETRQWAAKLAELEGKSRQLKNDLHAARQRLGAMTADGRGLAEKYLQGETIKRENRKQVEAEKEKAEALEFELGVCGEAVSLARQRLDSARQQVSGGITRQAKRIDREKLCRICDMLRIVMQLDIERGELAQQLRSAGLDSYVLPPAPIKPDDSKAPGVSYGSWRRELTASGALEPMLFVFADVSNMPYLPKPAEHCIGLWRGDDALYVRVVGRGVIGTSDDGRMEKVSWDKAEAAGLSKTDPRWNNPEAMSELQRCDLVARLLPMVSPKEADRTVQQMRREMAELA